MCEIPSFLCETQENRAKNVKKCAKMKKIVRNPKKLCGFSILCAKSSLSSRRKKVVE
jgi:hypothetical protein